MLYSIMHTALGLIEAYLYTTYGVHLAIEISVLIDQLLNELFIKCTTEHFLMPSQCIGN